MKKKQKNIACQKICYFKAGNVFNELVNTLSAKEKITGGPNYYVYSTKQNIVNTTQILYLSFNKKRMYKTGNNCIAKTIKATTFHKYCGLHVIKLAIHILKFKPQHIVCVNRRWLHIIYLVSKILGASFTVSVHTDLSARKKLDNSIIYHFLKLADSVICHGPYLRRQASEITGSEQKIIEYNASCQDLINLDYPLPANWDIIKKKKIIVFVGRMEIKKGVHDLYEACKKLLYNDDQLALCLAGGGKECNSLRNRSRVDKLEKQVVILDQLERRQIANLLRQAWVVVTPTRNKFPEGRCMAAMEALAMGVPVVAPNFGPFPYLVKNGINGFLYEPDSVIDLQNKLVDIQEILTHEKLKSGAEECSKAYVKTNLSYGEAFVQALSRGLQCL